jgi:predicted ArsR family transcriptional regulator
MKKHEYDAITHQFSDMMRRRERAMWYLYRHCGLSWKQIGAAYEITEKAVLVHIRRYEQEHPNPELQQPDRPQVQKFYDQVTKRK